MGKTEIEWADYTFNPWVGCSKVSAGCKYCYAEQLVDVRFSKAEWGDNGTRTKTSPSNWKKPISWDKKAKKEGVKYKVFCASLADVFEDRKELEEWRYELFHLIEKTPNLIWMLLTKRPGNVPYMFEDFGWADFDNFEPHFQIPNNVWIGTSVENQEAAEKRIPSLQRIPTEIKFLSCEPLIGDVDLDKWLCKNPEICQFCSNPSNCGDNLKECPHTFFDWVIVGGESGSKARIMHPNWLENLQRQCKEYKVPFFFKQWGGWTPYRSEFGVNVFCQYDDMGTNKLVSFAKVGKKKAGNKLNGKIYQESPKIK